MGISSVVWSFLSIALQIRLGLSGTVHVRSQNAIAMLSSPMELILPASTLKEGSLETLEVVYSLDHYESFGTPPRLARRQEPAASTPEGLYRGTSPE